MSFLNKMGSAFRAVNHGRSTAEAHRMAENFLESNLPSDVAANGFETVARIADYSSIEQMAMVYVITYANRMHQYLDAVGATTEFRTTVARNVARACILLAQLQRSNTDFDPSWTVQLIQAAKRHGVNTDSEKIRFAL